MLDDKWGERPLAVVAFKPDHTATVDDLRAHVAAALPKFWAPDRVIVVDALPRTSAGKFDERALRTTDRRRVDRSGHVAGRQAAVAVLAHRRAWPSTR